MSAQTTYPRFGTGSVPNAAGKWVDARRNSSATADAEKIGGRFGRAHSLPSASLPAVWIARFQTRTVLSMKRHWIMGIGPPFRLSRRQRRLDPRIAECPAASDRWVSEIRDRG